MMNVMPGELMSCSGFFWATQKHNHPAMDTEMLDVQGAQQPLIGHECMMPTCLLQRPAAPEWSCLHDGSHPAQLALVLPDCSPV
jgi:hypothetical protein